MAKKTAKKVAQSSESYLVTMKILVVRPTIDESQIVARATKRTNVFKNAFKGAKDVSLKEITMQKM